MNIKRSKKKAANCLKIPIKRLGFLFVLVLGSYMLVFSGLLWAGEMEGAEAPILEPQQEQVIKALSDSPKLTAPQEILRDFIDGKPTTRVIVNLRRPAKANQLQNFKDMAVRQELRQTVYGAQEGVIRGLDPAEVRITNRFIYVFGFSAEVSLKGLEDLVDNVDILSIEKDRILHAHLAQGIPLMNAVTPRSSYTGSGLSVAICDTGIDYTHVGLGGGGFPNSKVIGGYDCGDDDDDPMDESGHGTACAGVAAGDLGTVGDYIGGVAYNAKLYALKISHGSGGSAYTSNMVEAWEWCITHQYDNSSNPIMIISTSFGGGQYFSTCDGTSALMTTAAANAVAAGMPLFVSSGNDGYCDAMGWPACISHVISVGAVYDADFTASSIGWCVSSDSCAPKYATGGCTSGWYSPEVPNSDNVTVYSNTASFLTLLAPANWATTTELGGGYWDTANGFGGTSAACPYAAGAAACLQNAAKVLTGSYLTPGQVKSTLVDTGDSITDGKVSIAKPRVNLGAAVAPFAVPPSGLSATTASSSGIDLSWTDNSSNETGFKIERKTGSGGTYAEIATVLEGVTSYSSTGLTASTTYYYRVRAYNSDGDSSYSSAAYATTCPAAPSGLSATAASSSEIDLSWTDNSSDETGFKIERKTGSGGTYAQIGTVLAGVTSYSSIGLTASTTYYYQVRAYNSDGDSSYSSAAYATTCPAAPSGLSATTASSSEIDLSWTDNSSDETGFKIERKTGSGGTYQIDTVGADVTSYSSTGLTASTTYYYRVRAYNSNGDSNYSSEEYATTSAASGRRSGGGGGGGCFITTVAP